MRRMAVLAVALLANSAGAAMLRLPPVVVPPNTEREVCQYLQVRRGRPGWTIAGYRARIRGDSHHFYLLDASGLVPHTTALVDGPASACVDGTNLLPLVAALGPREALRLPDGIRLPWSTPQALVMNLHVVNGSDRPTTVRVSVRLDLRPTPRETRLATRWGVQVDQIDVLPFTTATVAARWTLPAPLALLTFGGHMHAQGTLLRAYRDGAQWYEQNDWEHPPQLRFLPPEVLPAGTELTVECTYDNGVQRPVKTCADDVPCPLVAGRLASDAMCNIQGYAVAP